MGPLDLLILIAILGIAFVVSSLLAPTNDEVKGPPVMFRCPPHRWDVNKDSSEMRCSECGYKPGMYEY